MFHFLMLHCIKLVLGYPYLMLNVPLFNVVLVAVGVVVIALFNVKHFNFPLVFATLFNVALLQFYSI